MDKKTMNFHEKYEALDNKDCEMNSSKNLCMFDALSLYNAGLEAKADKRLDDAAKYAFGFNLPEGWKD